MIILIDIYSGPPSLSLNAINISGIKFKKKNTFTKLREKQIPVVSLWSLFCKYFFTIFKLSPFYLFGLIVQRLSAAPLH